jgi:hypothetical protein
MTMSRDDFARLASDYLREQGESRPVRYDDARDRLVVGDGDWISFIGLHHALSEYDAASPAEKPRVLARRFWSSIRRDGPVSEVDVIRSVLPRVRDRAWFSAVRRQAELELGAMKRPSTRWCCHTGSSTPSSPRTSPSTCRPR